MSDKSRDEKNMTNVFLANATEWAAYLENSNGPGLERARRRIEDRYGISWAIIERLRHNRVKDISVTIYVQLQSAYLAECERQCRIIQAQAQIAKAKGLAGAPVVAEIEAVLDDEAA